MSHRLTKEELDAQFEQFLKESVSDDSVDLGGPDRQLHSKSSQKQTGSQEDGHSGGGSPRARLESRASFRMSESIQEEEAEAEGVRLKEEDLAETRVCAGAAMVPAVNMSGLGLDTLEEEEEKARFFDQLKAGASSTIDYSKLNRELDSATSTLAGTYRKVEEAEEAVERSADDQSKSRRTGMIRETAAFTGSPHYSSDFEDEEDVKLPLEEKSSAALARVSFYDSLDGTGEDERRKDTVGSLDRGQAYVQSGGSEVEAVQEAYRQIHTVEDSDDHGHRASSLEGRWKLNKPPSPSFPPQNAQQSLHPVSTTESELPTAEELMRPIRPEMEEVRGFSLQPVSAVEAEEKTSVPLERTFLVETSTVSLQPGPAAALINGARGLRSHLTSAPQPPNSDLSWSIKEEVDRLMQDHPKSSSLTLSHTGKAKKQPAFRGSVACTSSVGRATVAPVRGRRVDGRTAVTSRSSGISRGSATVAKTQSSGSHFSQHPQRAKSTKNQERGCWDCAAEPDVKVTNELVASVQSLVDVLQQQMDSTRQQDSAQEVREAGLKHLPQISMGQDSSVVEELRVQLAQKERELQMMKAGEEELSSLRQQNYLLQSKLRSAEEGSERKRRVEATDAAAEEKLQQIDKEIQEQEALIKGYQQENEKLCLQMKAQQAQSKANEEAMFKENQRLLKELASTREQLSLTWRPVGRMCSMDHTLHIADLLAQINTLQRNEAQMSEDIHVLKQERQDLEVELQLMKKERDLAKARASSASGEKTFDMRALEDKHQEEVAALKKELQRFAENQELLDRDAGRLKAATAEMQQLREQVKQLKQEVGKRNSWQMKARGRSVDVKRMKDLEQQVKELEQILRSRNPNSLPALIYAAATAAGHEKADAGVTALLERRIQRLEAELESHDEEAKRSLRAMEQQFHTIKLRYEQQICELEQQLEHQQQAEAAAAAGSHPVVSMVQTLEEELERVKQSHKEKEESLHEQMESLQQQLQQKAQPSPHRHQLQAEAAFGARLKRLNQELATKTRMIQELSRTVETLRKERRNVSASNARAQSRSTESRPQQPGLTKAHGPLTAGEQTFPAAQYEKTYQPTVFTGSHISEVVQENEALRQKVELLQLHSEQEKEALKADAAQAEQELCRLREEYEEQLSTMKAEHLRALDRLRVTHALEHSSSKAAELANKLSIQEITMEHLHEQLKELQGCKEALKISRTREDALQKQLTRLLQELKEAKEASSPEVKLLCSLERKILNMELRHQHREKELQQVIGGAWQTSGDDLQSEVEHWRRLAQDKSREMDHFRLELDSILDIVRHLQSQGVLLPTPDPPS